LTSPAVQLVIKYLFSIFQNFEWYNTKIIRERII